MYKPLLIHLRAGQMFAHNAHNLVKGALFSQDHDFFGEVYPAFETAYDAVIERCIGLHGETEDLKVANIVAGAALKLKQAPSVGTADNKTFYQFQLQLETELCSMIQGYIQNGVTPGTEQMLGNLADLSEIRQYKIKQRLK